MLEIKRVKRYNISNFKDKSHKDIFRRIISKIIYFILTGLFISTCSTGSKEQAKNETTTSSTIIKPTQTTENKGCGSKTNKPYNLDEPKNRLMGDISIMRKDL